MNELLLSDSALLTDAFAMAEGLGADVQLTRTHAIMQGASHCDFRYALKQSEKATR
jgi:L-2-amino-thiazoline-4-carboxylic acid hydrolase